MDSQRWQQIENLYNAIVACQPSERARLLDQADPEIRREVEQMLARRGSVLDGPAWEALPEETTTMLAPGHRLGRYEIEARLGAGGMGEVFRARDTRLNRTVALKVSKIQFSERFEREARAIAALNHPNICQLHDVAHDGGVDFLVMEYLEGETLASRLKKGALPLEKTLEYAIQIGDALDKAHRKGVTHRDLKPGNIMLTKSGAKLLDFGLAKWKHGGAAIEMSLSQLPTETAPITAQGTILGTLQYMAPEQLEGKEADARADIFAFGAVLYEMATGRRAFEGQSQASVIAKIVESDPKPIRSLQPMSPASLERLVTACLAKDREERAQSAHDVKRELEWIRDAAEEPAESKGSARGWRAAVPWVLFVATALGLVVFAWSHTRTGESAPLVRPIALQIPLPGKTDTRLFAISPDGTQLAFRAVSADGVSRIWVRDLSSLEIRPLPGTELVYSLLFWSPDGRFLAFDSPGELQRIDVTGGPPQAICRLPKTPIGGSWSKDGVILFGQFGGPIMRVSAGGGVAEPVTVLDAANGDVAHTDPQFLPDERHFVYLRDRDSTGNISVGSIDAMPAQQDPRRLVNDVLGPRYVASSGHSLGYLLYLRGLMLMAQRFDTGHLSLVGDAVRVVDAPLGRLFDFGTFSVSANGILAYESLENPKAQLTWFDERGTPLTTVGSPELYSFVALSPNGTQALLTMNESPTSIVSALLLMDMARGTAQRLEYDRSVDHHLAVWSPDGRGIVFSRAEQGKMSQMFETPAPGTPEIQAFQMQPGEWKEPLSWSRDGFLLYRTLGGAGLYRLWVVPAHGSQKPWPLSQTNFHVTDGRFAPDGHWLAYVSNESGRDEVYVRSFSAAGLGEGARVSTNGGSNPRWRQDGKEQELYYIGSDGKVMEVKGTSGAGFQPSVPMALFSAPGGPWDPSPDGKRFLFLVQQKREEVPITVVLNWQAGLKK